MRYSTALDTSSFPSQPSPSHAPTLLMWVGLFSLLCLSWIGQGCDTGFGQPCKLPQVESLTEACAPPPVNEDKEENEGTQQEFKATCAVDNFPTCETLSCLVYRGSSPYCSMRCNQDNDCDGVGVCCPLFGECNTKTMTADPAATDPDPVMSDPNIMMTVESEKCGDGFSPCYCIRKGDLTR